jgi:hypothetical protein
MAGENQVGRRKFMKAATGLAAGATAGLSGCSDQLNSLSGGDGSESGSTEPGTTRDH